MTNPGTNDQLRVSVILPTFNRAATIERACESVLSQEPPISELLVIDDGSTDRTSHICEEIAERDPRLKYIRQENAGACAARNRGIELAHGDLIAFQDSDDEWLPGKIAAQLTLRGRSPALVYTAHFVELLDGSEQVRRSNPRVGITGLLAHNFISTQTVLIDRALLGEERFDTRLRRLQDWDLWLSLATNPEIRFAYEDKPYVRLYRQQDSLSNSTTAYFDSLQVILFKHWRLYRTHPVRWMRHLARLVRFRATGIQ